MKKILVTGGAGYLGSVLVPKLIDNGNHVVVYDCLLFGREGLALVLDHPGLTLVQGDVRDHAALAATLGGVDAVIHLAAISNDPSSDLDPELTRQVNHHAVDHLMHAAKEAGVSRFLYASSASVYGIKETPDVTEDLPFDPLTIYAETKVAGEKILGALVDDRFCGVSVRAATVCGMSPRLRLDLTINILTAHAVALGEIVVFGGDQLRPNIHIQDLTDFYVRLLSADADKINGQAFNVCASNASVMDLARMIRDELGRDTPIRVEPTPDQRSYHLNADRAARVLGFEPRVPIRAAVGEIQGAVERGEVKDIKDPRYWNVAWMKAHPEFSSSNIDPAGGGEEPGR